MMSIVDELKDKIVTIQFDEWLSKGIKNKYFEVTFIDFLHAPTKRFKDTIYYVFEGCFRKDYSQFRMEKDTKVLFEITKKSFDKEIRRHLNFSLVKQEEIIDIKFKLKRYNYKYIHINSLTYSSTY